MRTHRNFLRPMLVSAALLAGACNHLSQGAAIQPPGTPGRTEAGSSALRDPGSSSDGGLSTEGWVDDAGSQTDGGVMLDCVKGGPVSAVHAEFHCGSVTVYTCKDLSNVVLEFEDGHRERFEDQSGHMNLFSGSGANANMRVTRVWIKAGANQSGEGPGYGERVDAPSESCPPPPAAGSGGTGEAGAGGTGEPCVNGPDMPCAGQPIAGNGNMAGSGLAPE